MSNENKESDGFLSNVLSNLTLVINNVHIRYEDDYFAKSLTVAFGVICKKVTSYVVNNEWNFGSIENSKFNRAIPKDTENLKIRETNLKDIRMYWKSPAEMIIPLSLYEATKNAEKQIFDAISIDDIKNMMEQSSTNEDFIEQFSFYMNFSKNYRPTAIKEAKSGKRYKVKIDLLLTKFALNITPRIIENIIMLKEYVQNFAIRQELKNYRPKLRPIVSNETSKLESDEMKRKRLLIVRDWFYFVVWANRIKKLIKNYDENSSKKNNNYNDFKTIYTKFFPNQYKKSIKNSSNDLKFSDDKVKDYINELEKRLNAEESIFKWVKNHVLNLITNGKISIRMQEIKINLYSSNTNSRAIENKKLPLIQFILIVSDFFI